MTDVRSMLAAGDLVVDERNLRVKLHQYDRSQISRWDGEMRRLAAETSATKLIVYAKKADVAEWERHGFRQEGKIDGFFGGENAQMMSCFLTEERAKSAAPQLADDILQISLKKAADAQEKEKALPEGFTIRPAAIGDAGELAGLYKRVFDTYPTPMDDPDYVRKTMHGSTCYYVVESGGRIVCAASAEVTERFGSAELTDCATHPDYLGKGLLQPLFSALEQKMEQMGIYYLYTLTRAQSAGMNITAAKQGYRYRGRMINNCTIFSGFEDMNIWVKPLRATWE
jgi:putative beta-lysine N-acetyltransferase